MKDNNDITIVTLAQWFEGSHTDDEKKEVFLYMDLAMKYVHERGYCVATFNPRQIQILNDSLNCIRFNSLLMMSPEYEDQLIREDIFNSALLQVGLYSKCLDYINPEFVKENFDSFAKFLPIDDVPYYQGVIERGAKVYFVEFEQERIKRETEAYSKELSKGSSKIIDITPSIVGMKFTNDKVNNKIYRNINSKSAFANIVMYPLILGILVLLSIIYVYIIHFINM